MIVHDNVRQVLPMERESHGLRCATPWWRVGSLSSAAMFKAPYLSSMNVAPHETEISSHVNTSQFRRDAIVPPQGLFRYAPLLRVLQHTTPRVEIQESSVRVPSTTSRLNYTCTNISTNVTSTCARAALPRARCARAHVRKRLPRDYGIRNSYSPMPEKHVLFSR